MAKHLIIGLGGTGGNVICELRKRIYEEYRSHDPKVDDVFIDYLYVDSSKQDLLGLDAEGKHETKFRKKWQTLGESVELTPAQTFFIGGMQREIIDNLHKYNNINSFFSEQDREDTSADLGSIIGAGIGGQRRRFGRLLFSNSSSQESFVDRINKRVNELMRKGAEKGDKNSNVTFHICAGLGGGTGSGTIIDAISLIRKTYPQFGEEHKHRICLYLYIPEALVTDSRHEGTYYQSNGYAALSEINALSLGEYMPIDITDRRDDVSVEEKRIEKAGFEAAYLYTDHNYADNKYELDELPKIAADFLFQKLLVGISNRFEKNENAGLAPEKTPNGVPVHATNFMSFGIKRLIYPESEIHEYVSYKFAYTSAMQMLWGWPKNAQYPTELSYDEINVSPNEIKGRDDYFQKRQTLHITDTRLKLDSTYFDSQVELARKANWRPIKDFWTESANKIYNQVVNMDKSVRISKLNSEMGQQYMNYFRGNGVVSFYKNCLNDKVIYADEVVNHIGNYLLTDWKDGRRSLAEVGKFLDILIEDCKERFERYDDRIGEHTKYLDKYSKECNIQAAKFNNSGIAGLITDKKTFAQYKDCLIARYIAQTEIQAYGFAKQLMAEIVDKLVALRGNVTEFTNVMIQYIKDNETLADEKCQDGDGGYTATSEVVKLYEPTDIKKLVNKFVHEEEKQKANTSFLFTKLCEPVDSEKTHFAGLAKLFANADNVESVLAKQCQENAKARLDDYAVEDKTQKLLDINILEKLRSDPQWETLVEKMCDDAMILIRPNTKEIVDIASNTHMIEFGLPKFPEDEQFKNKVIQKVRNFFEGKNYPIGEPYESSRNQFVIITGLTKIPVRYIKSVETLKEKYDEFVRNNVCHYKMVHTESFVKPLPSLYWKSQEELRVELRPLLLLAYNIKGIVEVEEDMSTGEKILAVAQKNSGGKISCYNRLDRPDDVASSFLYFDKTVRKTLDKLSKREGDVFLLNGLISEQLKLKYMHNDKKRELLSDIKKFVKNLLATEFDNDTTNKELQAFAKACDGLEANELKEK